MLWPHWSTGSFLFISLVASCFKPLRFSIIITIVANMFRRKKPEVPDRKKNPNINFRIRKEEEIKPIWSQDLVTGLTKTPSRLELEIVKILFIFTCCFERSRATSYRCVIFIKYGHHKENFCYIGLCQPGRVWIVTTDAYFYSTAYLHSSHTPSLAWFVLCSCELKFMCRFNMSHEVFTLSERKSCPQNVVVPTSLKISGKIHELRSTI